MCGIIAAVAQRDIKKILLEGLRRLEYRGYDSAGLVLVNISGKAKRFRCVGKVNELIKLIKKNKPQGYYGIAHTRWATHGTPTKINAHPHISEYISVVHNGIIENYESLRVLLIKRGYYFQSETDTEVIAHLVHWEKKQNSTLVESIKKVVSQLDGTYSIVIMDCRNPTELIGVCSGSPLIIGLGVGENFIASDQLALLTVTSRFIFLEEGDLIKITCHTVDIFNIKGKLIKRPEIKIYEKHDAIDKGFYKHYMKKEIYEQPITLKNTLEGRLNNRNINLNELDAYTDKTFLKVQHIQIVACGTSYHSGMVGRYWFEALSGIPCSVETASEFRYRQIAKRQGNIIITLSQSGETADTLAALRLSKKLGYLCSVTICNVTNSSLVRESDLSLMIRAGTEIGVASTKTFTSQLVVLLMFVIHISRLHGMKKQVEHNIVRALKTLPTHIKQILSMDKNIEILSKNFYNKNNALFLGRGNQYPIAMEGALKLKEISYIHAEAYPAGELKHGPLALIDIHMPIIILAPKNYLLKKLKSNIEEVYARGGQLYIFADENAGFVNSDRITIIPLPHVEEIITPILYTIPLQILSYYVGIIKGTDIDRPRNLAKSVTVE
ncbi:Glutamine--fructose-6-phosphate aminotransferase [isomerizing] [Candidatus Ecksteinia adelgidicola]|nr:Glutamine--fructose-6-phosphate aminotransferase [isomerizing] [Candidatus Ecksteinia adelgidicola]